MLVVTLSGRTCGAVLRQMLVLMLLGHWIGIGPSCSVIDEPVLVLGCLKRLSHAKFTVWAFDDIFPRSRCQLLWLGVIALPSIGRRLFCGCLDDGTFRLQRLTADALL